MFIPKVLCGVRYQCPAVILLDFDFDLSKSSVNLLESFYKIPILYRFLIVEHKPARLTHNLLFGIQHLLL